MLVLTKTTNDPPAEILAQARKYFGHDGLGLKLVAESPCSISLAGGGGYVTVRYAVKDGQASVDVETSEWEHHIHKFMAQLP